MSVWKWLFGRDDDKAGTPPSAVPPKPSKPKPKLRPGNRALALLSALPDPLVGVTGVDPSELEPVREVLRGNPDHHFPVYQALKPILDGRDWAWPGAERAVDPHHSEAINDLAAAMWLSWRTRKDAVGTIKGYLESAAELGPRMTLQVDVLPADDCPVCAVQKGPMGILERIEAGLPPFHGGCRCCLIPVIKR